MPLVIAPATVDQLPPLADICYRAFKDISSRHGFETDFDSPALAAMVLNSLISNEHCHSIAALLDGRPAGSNFLSVSDSTGAVGPVSVDPGAQGAGIGRALMEDVLRYARENGVEDVRLMQDAFNMTSLALYATLGFDTKAPCAFMDPTPAADDSVRQATPDDLDAVEALGCEIYRVSRRNEVAHLFGSPFQPFVRERNGRVAGYFAPGIAGHGAAESEDDLIALVRHAATVTPPPLARFFCPLLEGSLYRGFLEAGCRNRKVMNLMARGPYKEPRGPWLPSVGF